MSKYISKDQLITGKVYQVEARTFIPLNNGIQVAEWNGEKFRSFSSKLGFISIGYEFHWDDHEKHGTVKPIKCLG